MARRCAAAASRSPSLIKSLARTFSAFRDDLRRLPGWSESRQRAARCASACSVAFLPVAARRTAASLCATGKSGSVVNQSFAKQPPISLEGQEYGKLCEGVLRCDNWRCQFCGSINNLEIHHQQFRSHSGEDTEDNLITLCHSCHSSAHIS
jgi:hypothetical protein